MPYKVLVEEVSILKKIGELIDQQGNKHDEHASVTYYFGDVVPDSEVAPTVVRAYDADDHHARSILERTDAEPTVPERKPSALPEAIVPEPEPEPEVEPLAAAAEEPIQLAPVEGSQEPSEEDLGTDEVEGEGEEGVPS
jgi:hypothetical protein